MAGVQPAAHRDLGGDDVIAAGGRIPAPWPAASAAVRPGASGADVMSECSRRTAPARSASASNAAGASNARRRHRSQPQRGTAAKRARWSRRCARRPWHDLDRLAARPAPARVATASTARRPPPPAAAPAQACLRPRERGKAPDPHAMALDQRARRDLLQPAASDRRQAGIGEPHAQSPRAAQRSLLRHCQRQGQRQAASSPRRSAQMRERRLASATSRHRALVPACAPCAAARSADARSAPLRPAASVAERCRATSPPGAAPPGTSSPPPGRTARRSRDGARDPASSNPTAAATA